MHGFLWLALPCCYMLTPRRTAACCRCGTQQVIALQKTIDVYTNQPALGTPKALAKLQLELADAEKRMEDIKRDTMKFEL